MKYRVGLIEFSPGRYPGMLAIGEDGEGVFDAHTGPLTDIPVKQLSDLDSQYKQTVADPNPDNDYLRGYNNGVRLAHATIFGYEPKFIEPQEAEMHGTVTMGDLVDKGHLAEFRTPPAPVSHSYYNELVDANGLIDKLRSEIRDLQDTTREYRTTNNGLAMSIDRLTKERDEANASAAFHARNREKGDIDHERERKALIEQRDVAQGEAEHLYKVVTQTQAWSDWHRENAATADEANKAIARLLAERPPFGPAPYPVFPYALPKHMQPAPAPAPTIGYPPIARPWGTR